MRGRLQTMARVLRRLLLAVLAPLVTLEALLWIGHAVLPVSAHRSGDSPARHAILCVGDSHTYGLRVELRSYPNQLRSRLELAKEGPFHVVNRGWPSLNSTQLVDLLPEYLAEVEPDFVFILTGYNNSWYLAGSSLLNRLFGWSRTYKLLKLLLVRDAVEPRVIQEGTRLFLIDGSGKWELGRHELSRADARRGEELKRVTQRDLRTLVQLVRERGARPLLMTYPSEANEAFLTVNDAVRAAARSLEVPLVDHAARFREALRERSYETLIFPGDHHCNAQGYALMVEGLLETMQELGWIATIPPPPVPASAGGPPIAVSLEKIASAGQVALRLRSEPGFLFQLFLAHAKLPGPPESLDPRSLLEAADTPQFKAMIPLDGSIEIAIPSTYLEAAPSLPLYAQAVICDSSTWTERGRSAVLEIRADR
ncbi:MAG: SGNH/GDSL hydrolase family protein [Planctomycetota bacterium]